MSKTKNRISSIRTALTFFSGRACSDTLFHVLNRAFDHPLNNEEGAVMPFAGGIKQQGYQCGMIWGAALSAGAQVYRVLGPGPRAETAAVNAAQKLVESFRIQNNHIDCYDITNINKSSSTMKMITYFLVKGGAIGCTRRAAKYAPEAFKAITAALSEDRIDSPPPPVSCAAIVAQKMGASERHTVMASGLAGGIGLCGGACGALGAAIWIIGIISSKDKGAGNLWKDEAFNKRTDDLIERFLKSADYEFECSEIVGRKFRNIDDHAGYLRTGGCSKIIDILATA